MIYQSPLLGNIAVSLALVLACLTYILRPHIAQIELIVFSISLFLIGIPHGAVDHIISRETSKNPAKHSSLLFYLTYIGALILMSLIWLLSPFFGFIVFLALSIYHFGVTDVQRLHLNGNKRKVLGISRGILVIALLILSNTEESFVIIHDLLGFEFALAGWIQQYYAVLIFATLFLFALIQVALFDMDVMAAEVRQYFADSILLAVLFLISGPIVGFAIYFALWHSLKHVEEYVEFRGSENLALGIWSFYKDAFLFSIISFMGLAGMIGLYLYFGIDTNPIAISLILISALTLPHVMVIEKLYFKGS